MTVTYHKTRPKLNLPLNESAVNLTSALTTTPKVLKCNSADECKKYAMDVTPN
ncbi:unnamed protein product [Ceratitis capitata]|uniref:(Mediterranean fruit fly) hypothetical protein n=1 Tax=Ceratitis capitata TaxID=7213 RepID=A0A811UXA1_CERCA|nr:unnamed protein product [Ceratitis capitata]